MQAVCSMATYDTDGNGSIDQEEFIVFLNHMQHEIERHMHQLCHLPVLSLLSSDGNSMVKQRRHGHSAAATRYGNADNAEGRYIPPLTGSLLMEVVDTHTFKDVVYTVASCNRVYSDIVAQNTPDPEAVSLLCLMLTQIRVDDAVGICQDLARRRKNDIRLLVKLLHQISSVADARLLISEVVGGDRTKMVRLRQEMGTSLKVSLGMLNGFYCLDLSLPTERKALVTLYEQSRTLNHRIASQSPLGYGLTGDLSQKGNWSCFRNELLNGQPSIIGEEFITNLPHSGTIEFDYSGEARFVAGHDVVTKDFAVVTMLVHVGLLEDQHFDKMMSRLKEMKDLSSTINAANDGRTLTERSWEDVLEMGKHSCAFYENLTYRAEMLAKANLDEKQLNARLDPQKLKVQALLQKKVKLISSLNAVRRSASKSRANKVFPLAKLDEGKLIGSKTKSPRQLSSRDLLSPPPRSSAHVSSPLHKGAFSVRSPKPLSQNSASEDVKALRSPHLSRQSSDVAEYWKNHVLDNGHLNDLGELYPSKTQGGAALASIDYDDDTTRGEHFYGVIKS